MKLPTRLDRELLFRPSKITTRRDGRHSRDATGEFQCSVLVRHFSSYAAANEADPDIARGSAAAAIADAVSAQWVNSWAVFWDIKHRNGGNSWYEIHGILMVKAKPDASLNSPEVMKN